jgi:hypothetical protein
MFFLDVKYRTKEKEKSYKRRKEVDINETGDELDVHINT